MNKTINFRYLIRLLVILAVIAGAVYLLHHRQSGRMADAFLSQASAAERESLKARGDFGRAVSYLRRYLVLKPQDAEVRARAAMLSAESSQTPGQKRRSLEELQQVLVDAPKRDDVRRRAIVLAMEVGDVAVAQKLIKEFLDTNPNDAEMYERKGICQATQGDYEGAGTSFQTAITKKPDLYLAYGRYAALLRSRLAPPKKADEVIEELLTKNGGSSSAHLVAAHYFLENGRGEKFAEQVSKAEECDANNAEVLLAKTEVAKMTAEEHLKAARKAKDLAKVNEEKEESRKVIEGVCPMLRHGIDTGVAKLRADDGPFSDDAEVRIHEREMRARDKTLLTNMFLALIGFELRLDRLPEAKAVAKHGIEVLPEYLDLRLQMADVCIREKQWDEAKNQIDTLAKLDYPPAILGYYRGHTLAGSRKWLEAIEYLEAAAANAADSPPLLRQIEFLLGDCYSQVGLTDRRYEAYLKALPPDPLDELWFPVSMRTATALAEMRRPREAIAMYERVALQYANAFVPLARLKLQETLRQSEAAPDWGPVEKLLESAPEGVDRELLQADLRFAQKKPDEACDALLHACKTYPDAPEPWAALAYLQFLKLREKPETAAEGRAQAAKTLAEAEGKFGDRVLFRLMRARLIPADKPAEVAAEVERLAQDSDKFTPDERMQLLMGLADIAQASATPTMANFLWDHLANLAPDNLGIQLNRFNNALKANDKARLLEAKEQIERIDHAGPDLGSSARTAQVLYLIWDARQTGDTQRLGEAQDLLRVLARQRASSERIPLAEAVILDMKKDYVGAISKFREAIELGERDPDAIRRLFELYAEQRQFREANELLRLLPENAKKQERFQLLEMEVSLQTNQLKHALDLAAKLAPADSRDFRRQLQRYGIYLFAAKTAEVNGNPKEAEANYEQAKIAVQRALEISSGQPEGWIAAVQFYVNTGNKALAEKTIDEAKTKLNETDKSFALAQCYEMVGKFEEAAKMYDLARKSLPNDIVVLKSCASFQLMRGNNVEAARLLEQILANEKISIEEKRSTQRLLAITLALNRDAQTSHRALEVLGLLDPNGLPKALTGTETAEEIHVQAIAFALQRGIQSKREAIKLLEDARAQRNLPDEDLFLLAELHYKVGEWPSTRAILSSLIKTAVNPLYLQFFAFHLVAHSDLAQADKIVKTLEKLQPNAIQTIELRARVLAASGEITKARDLLLQQADKPNANVLGIARLLEELGAPVAAEPLYERLIVDPKKPETKLLLADFYGRQNRTQEALRICEQLGTSVRPEAVCAAAVSALYSAQQPRDAEIRQVVVQVDGFLRQHPDAPALLSCMAAALNLAGDYTGAISHYRKAMSADPKDIAARNNLAYLVSAHEKRYDEALQELDRAEKAFGRQATLLDTEAQVYLAKKEPGKAIALLEQALDERQKGSYYFHLAQAYSMDNKPLDARVAWNKAHKDYHLKAADLHALERPEYQRLASQFASP
jgi:tetratricopeptide (TPR) repeat protein